MPQRRAIAAPTLTAQAPPADTAEASSGSEEVCRFFEAGSCNGQNANYVKLS